MGASCCTVNLNDQDGTLPIRYIDYTEQREPLFNHNQGVTWSTNSERNSKWNPRSNNSKNSTKDLSVTVREMNEPMKLERKTEEE